MPYIKSIVRKSSPGMDLGNLERNRRRKRWTVGKSNGEDEGAR